MYWYWWDPTYILVIIGAVISIIASANVNSKFNKYSRITNYRGLTGETMAKKMLQGAGITDVRVERVSGKLSDHYDPKNKVLRLSDSTFSSTSVAAIGVAAHECGHAIQHQENYFPLKLRSLSVPVANIGSFISWPLVIIGIIFGLTNLAKIGVIFFCAVVFFQLITLPVEFNASKRALTVLENDGILYGDELSGAKKVLGAAALTYVAALATSLLQLLRLVLLVRRRSD